MSSVDNSFRDKNRAALLILSGLRLSHGAGSDFRQIAVHGYARK